MYYSVLYPVQVDYDEPPLNNWGWIKTPKGGPSVHLHAVDPLMHPRHKNSLVITLGYPIEMAGGADFGTPGHIKYGEYIIRYHPGKNGHSCLFGSSVLGGGLERLADPKKLLPVSELCEVADQIGDNNGEFWGCYLIPLVGSLESIPTDVKQRLQKLLVSGIDKKEPVSKKALGDLLVHPDRKIRVWAAMKIGSQDSFPE